MFKKTKLLELLSIPTAPYRESLVLTWLKAELAKNGVKFFQDKTGNLVLGPGSPEEYRQRLSRQTEEPVRIFIAHTDHPGFHGVKWLGQGRLQVKWFGGSPTKFLNGAKVWVSNDQGEVAEGIFRAPKMNKARTAIESGVVALPKTFEATATTLWGGFGFRKPVWEKGKVLYTKAADDLVGTFAIVQTAIYAKEKGIDSFVGLLTRAEEVGFIGCIGHFAEPYLKEATRPLVCVSLETSRTLPGAIIGKGPVVRLGDRASVFSGAPVEVLTAIAKKRLGTKYQRRIMDGGTCEATVAVAHRIPSVGISIPLGNYHNQSFEGGPDSRGARGPAPEFVHTDDIEGMLDLCEGLLDSGLAWMDPWVGKRAEFADWLEKARALLF